MRILVISWEFPPRIVGGLGRHVDRLTEAIAAQGHEVHVLTRGRPDYRPWSRHGRVEVHHAADYPPQIDDGALISSALQTNHGMIEQGLELCNKFRFDVIHAHDWLVAFAATTLTDVHRTPLVSTMHATEFGRHQGWLGSEVSRYIHQAEWWLTYISRRVITCSPYMRDQVEQIFELPTDKLDVVPNGVALRFEQTDRRVESNVPTILFAGRLEYEKGMQTLIEAAPNVVDEHPGARFVVAGTGTYESDLRRIASDAGLADYFDFRGFVDDDEMPKLYAEANVVVVPSIYEPFGIVALEAMAAGVPAVVGATGGLVELVDDEVNGLSFEPEDATALARSVNRLLEDPALVADLVEGGADTARNYEWRVIAARTAEIYRQTIDEEIALRTRLERREPLRLVWDASRAYRHAIDPSNVGAG